VAVTAVAALRTITGGRELIDTDIEARGGVRFAAEVLQRDLSNLYRDRDPKNVKLLGGVNGATYTPSSLLTWMMVNRSSIRPGEPEGDVCEVEYFLREDEEGHSLMRRMDPYPFEREEPGGMLTTIVENVTAFDVLFFDRQNEEWVEEWSEERGHLPQMVQVTVAVQLSQQNRPAVQSFLVSFPRWPQGR